jgi:hypothetical protein
MEQYEQFLTVEIFQCLNSEPYLRLMYTLMLGLWCVGQLIKMYSCKFHILAELTLTDMIVLFLSYKLSCTLSAKKCQGLIISQWHCWPSSVPSWTQRSTSVVPTQTNGSQLKFTKIRLSACTLPSTHPLPHSSRIAGCLLYPPLTHYLTPLG